MILFCADAVHPTAGSSKRQRGFEWRAASDGGTAAAEAEVVAEIDITGERDFALKPRLILTALSTKARTSGDEIVRLPLARARALSAAQTSGAAAPELSSATGCRVRLKRQCSIAFTDHAHGCCACRPLASGGGRRLGGAAGKAGNVASKNKAGKPAANAAGKQSAGGATCTQPGAACTTNKGVVGKCTKTGFCNAVSSGKGSNSGTGDEGTMTGDSTPQLSRLDIARNTTLSPEWLASAEEEWAVSWMAVELCQPRSLVLWQAAHRAQHNADAAATAVGVCTFNPIPAQRDFVAGTLPLQGCVDACIAFDDSAATYRRVFDRLPPRSCDPSQQLDDPELGHRTAAECATRCNATAGCTHFLYSDAADGPKTKTGACTLFSGCSALTVDVARMAFGTGGRTFALQPGGSGPPEMGPCTAAVCQGLCLTAWEPTDRAEGDNAVMPHYQSSRVDWLRSCDEQEPVMDVTLSVESDAAVMLNPACVGAVRSIEVEAAKTPAPLPTAGAVGGRQLSFTVSAALRFHAVVCPYALSDSGQSMASNQPLSILAGECRRGAALPVVVLLRQRPGLHVRRRHLRACRGSRQRRRDQDERRGLAVSREIHQCGDRARQRCTSAGTWRGLHELQRKLLFDVPSAVDGQGRNRSAARARERDRQWRSQRHREYVTERPIQRSGGGRKFYTASAARADANTDSNTDARHRDECCHGGAEG